MRKHKSDAVVERGFSLIEVMIAILILMVGLLSLAQMMALATNANAISGRMTATAALAKEQLELLKAAPFYTNPADITVGSINGMLQVGGDLENDAAVGAQDYFQYYDRDGQPLVPNSPATATFVARWRVDQIVPPGGDGNMPLAMLRITVRCRNMATTYQGAGDATLVTFRTANIG